MALLLFVYMFASLAVMGFGFSENINMVGWIGAALYVHATYSLLDRAASQKQGFVLTIACIIMAILTLILVGPLSPDFLPANALLRNVILLFTITALIGSVILMAAWNPLARSEEEEGI